jgi:WD40 repeat protein
VLFSPDGKSIVSGGHDGLIYLWDAKTYRKVRQFGGHAEPVVSVAFSPDGKRLVSGSKNGANGDLRLWDVSSGMLIRQLGKPGQATCAVAFAPDGKMIASGHSRNTVCLWDATTGRKVGGWTGTENDNTVSSLAFTFDGRILAAAGYDGSIRLWALNSGKEVQSPAAEGGSIYSIAFSPDGSILATAGHHIHLYRIPGAKELKAGANELKALETLDQQIKSVLFCQDGRTLVSASSEGTIRLWDVSTGKERLKLLGLGNFITTLAVSPDGTTLASSGGHAIQIWDLDSGKECGRFVGHQGSVHTVRFLYDGQAVFSHGQRDPVFNLWVGERQKNVRPLPLPQDWQTFAACPDRDTLAVMTRDGTFFVLEIGSGRVLRSFSTGDSEPSRLAISLDGKRAVACIDRTVRIWDVHTERRLYSFAGFEFTPSALAISRDGRTLAVAGDNHALRIWDLETGKERCPCRGHTQNVTDIAFSPDGRMIGSTSEDATVRLWETSTGKERSCFKGHKGWTWSPVFSPDGKSIASGSDDETVRLWSVLGGQELCTFRGHQGRVFSVDFSPNGETLASGSEDTTILIWNVPAVMRTRTTKATRSRADLLWDELTSDDAAAAFRAMTALVEMPAEAVPLCKSHLAAIRLASPEQIDIWIRDLDNEKFLVRQQATWELERVGELAVPSIYRVLGNQPSLETRRRLKGILDRLKERPMSPRQLQGLRAIEVLEYIDSADADEVLKGLTGRETDPWIAAQAKVSLVRMKARAR